MLSASSTTPKHSPGSSGAAAASPRGRHRARARAAGAGRARRAATGGPAGSRTPAPCAVDVDDVAAPGARALGARHRRQHASRWQAERGVQRVERVAVALHQIVVGGQHVHRRRRRARRRAAASAAASVLPSPVAISASRPSSISHAARYCVSYGVMPSAARHRHADQRQRLAGRRGRAAPWRRRRALASAVARRVLPAPRRARRCMRRCQRSARMARGSAPARRWRRGARAARAARRAAHLQSAVPSRCG